MARLYSDLLSGSGGRYYYHLTTAPGGITNAQPARLTVGGNQPTIQELSQVFRTPATALLTLTGYAPLAEPRLQPAVATLTTSQLVAGEQRMVTITNSLTPNYTDLPDNSPTAFLIMTVAPAQAALSINYPAPNLTQGGNIGTISVGLGAITLQGRVPTIAFFAGSPAQLAMSGLVASLAKQIVVSPVTGELVMSGSVPTTVVPFHWLDDDPATPVTLWVDDPPA